MTLFEADACAEFVLNMLKVLLNIIGFERVVSFEMSIRRRNRMRLKVMSLGSSQVLVLHVWWSF